MTSSSENDATSGLKKKRRQSISGRVIGVDVGEWAGFTAGVIYLQGSDGRRFELRYTRNTQGTVPDIGSEIIAEFTGEHIHTLTRLEQVSESSLDRLSSRNTDSSGTPPLFSKPPAAIILSVVVILSACALIFWGIFGDFFQRYSASSTAIYIASGIVYLIFGYGIWYSADRE